jgi:diguanylate cyclase (GGDEF)-like protein
MLYFFLKRVDTAWFSSKLLSEIEHNTRVGEAIFLIIMDVDHFKRLNDTYVHSSGNMVLARLGQRINENIRAHDVPFLDQWMMHIRFHFS